MEVASAPNSEVAVREAVEGRDDEAATKLMVEYLDWALAKMAKEQIVFEGSFDPESVRLGLEQYRPPSGRLLIAELGGDPVGVGALRSLGDKVVEIKRMYVQPAARGLHAGSKILDRLLIEARKMNCSLVRLDSAWFMAEAQVLYKSRGFSERTPYEGTEIPLNLQPRWKFFEKRM